MAFFSCKQNGYVCKFCELFGDRVVTRGVDSPFITGTVLGDHPIRKLTAHEETDLHQTCTRMYVQTKENYLCDQSSTIPAMFQQQKLKKANANEVQIKVNRKYMACLLSTVNLVLTIRTFLSESQSSQHHVLS